MGQRRTRALTMRVLALVEAQGGCCAYCPAKFTLDDIDVDEPSIWPTFDHVVPKSKGGSNSLKNGLAACGPCNHRKGNRQPTRRELDILARITPLAAPIYLRLRAERATEPRTARPPNRKQRRKAAEVLRRYLHQIVFTPVVHRFADRAYVERESGVLTAGMPAE